MWCPVCAWAVEETLRKTDGVEDPVCVFSTDILTCRYDPLRTSADAVRAAIDRLGYGARSPDAGAPRAGSRPEFIRLAVSAFLTANTMMLSFALYFGFFETFTPPELRALSLPIFFLATVVFFYGGWPIHTRALASFKTGYPGMETLIATGAAAAYGISLAHLLAGSLDLYFDTCSMLITLVLVGKFLERGARDRIGRNLSTLFSLRPAKARICLPEAPEGRYVSAALLQPGDTFRVGAGEGVPADGTILSGRGAVDESTLTGEALPRARGVGDRLMSGTRVTDGDLRVRAERVGGEATLGQMISLIEGSLAEKGPFEELSGRYLRWFVPLVIFLAAGTAVVSSALGAPVQEALIRAISVLVVSCPCALGVAVPLARTAGVSVAAGRGILVRSASAFERATGIQEMVFDKTGTLTRGNWRLKKIVEPVPSSEAGNPGGRKEAHWLSLAAGLEAGADHPLAAEIRREAERRRLSPLPVTRVEVHENGISGIHGDRKVRLGALGFIAASAQNPPSPICEASSDTDSRVYLAIDGEPAAVFVFGDEIRSDARPLLEALQARGIGLSLVSGDDAGATANVAEKLGMDRYQGEQLPADKVAFIRRHQAAGKRTAMVGDGINDAPALAAADLSIAVGSGYQLSEETAHVALMGDELGRLVAFLDLSRRVRKKTAQNLAFSFLYNAVAIPVAMAGLLSPLVAVSAMLLSSLSVIGNTLLLVRTRMRSG
jgi:heavy metal translocating P-type ATPase